MSECKTCSRQWVLLTYYYARGLSCVAFALTSEVATWNPETLSPPWPPPPHAPTKFRYQEVEEAVAPESHSGSSRVQ